SNNVPDSEHSRSCDACYLPVFTQMAHLQVPATNSASRLTSMCSPSCGVPESRSPRFPQASGRAAASSATPAIFPDLTEELLCRGSCVRFRGTGHRMQPTIEDGEVLTVAP